MTDRLVLGLDALKALGHPLRMQVLTRLAERGHATASQLAGDLGESSGATSYHLRVLARHGLVVDDPDHSTGRDRAWRPRPGGYDLPGSLAEAPEGQLALNLVNAEQHSEAMRLEQDFVNHRTTEFVAWQESASRITAHLDLDPRQAVELHEELVDLVNRYKQVPRAAESRRVFVGMQITPTRLSSDPQAS